jgi:hypothetical protein
MICNGADISQVDSGMILASYPVPPSLKFQGNPVSVREKTAAQTIRTTYCATKHDTLRIVCFQTNGEDSVRPEQYTSPSLKDQDSPVVHLDVFVNRGEKQIVAIQHNGAFTAFSADLQSKISQGRLVSSVAESFRLQTVKILTVSEAQRTVLKRRPDVVNSATATSICIVAVHVEPISSVKSVRYALWTVNVDSSGHSKTAQPVIDHQLTLDTEAQVDSGPKPQTYSFDSKTSSLFVHARREFKAYDLTRLVPVPTSTLSDLTSGYSALAVSSALAIYSVYEDLRLYELKFGAVHAEINIKPKTLKRKRANPEVQHGTLDFVTYFPNSSRLIARRQNQLLAIDISSRSSSRTLHKGSSLLQNIGRAADGRIATLQPILPKSTPNNAAVDSEIPWRPVQEKLDQLYQDGDYAAFEDTFSKHIWDCSQSLSTARITGELPCFGVPALEVKTNYLISKMFQLVKPADSNKSQSATDKAQMTVRIPSSKLLKWFAKLGMLSSRNIQQIMTTKAAGAIDASVVVDALNEADDTMVLLTICLENGFSPYVDDQAAIVQRLVQVALDMHVDATPILEQTRSPDVDTEIPEKQLQQLPQSATESSWLPKELQQALILAINNFGSSSRSNVSTNLKSKLSQTQVLALIQFLRQQLFQAGYTRSSTITPTIYPSSLSTIDLAAAIKVLSGCIDAIGPLGFSFAGVENEDFIGNIIPELVTEIANTKQSLDDVAEVQGTIRESLRYHQSITKHQNCGARVTHHPNGILTEHQQPGSIITIYAEPTNGDANMQNGACLPLSLKVDNVVDPLKVRKGGGQVMKRSVRQKMMLERRMVGEYAFERLVL